MPFGVDDAILLAGMGASAASSMLGQVSTNKTNIRLAQENRDWQERMSGSAYQRSMDDLKKAGLNPLLAVGAQASTPAGNVATTENAPDKGVQSALASAQLMRQNQLTKATTDNINADTNVKKGSPKYWAGVAAQNVQAPLTSSANSIKDKYKKSYISKIGKDYSIKDYLFEKKFERQNKK